MVVEEGKPVGVLTRHDLLGFLSDGRHPSIELLYARATGTEPALMIIPGGKPCYWQPLRLG